MEPGSPNAPAAAFLRLPPFFFFFGGGETEDVEGKFPPANPGCKPLSLWKVDGSDDIP